MKASRVGSRIASATRLAKPCVEAVRARTLATKVFDYSFPSFPRGGGLGRRPAVVWIGRGGQQPVGVWLRLRRGGKCRLGRSVALAATSFAPVALVTKEKTGGLA